MWEEPARFPSTLFPLMVKVVRGSQAHNPQGGEQPKFGRDANAGRSLACISNETIFILERLNVLHLVVHISLSIGPGGRNACPRSSQLCGPQNERHHQTRVANAVRTVPNMAESEAGIDGNAADGDNDSADSSAILHSHLAQWY